MSAMSEIAIDLETNYRTEFGPAGLEYVHRSGDYVIGAPDGWKPGAAVVVYETSPGRPAAATCDSLAGAVVHVAQLRPERAERRRVVGEVRTLNAATGPDIETRARCQDDGHPVGAVHPSWFGPAAPGSFCHCGRVIYRGVLDVEAWPRPAAVSRLRWPAADCVADRVGIYDARRVFELGGRVVVSSDGYRTTLTVTPATTVHTRETTTWPDLVEQVNTWRNRYPNQRYYVVRDERGAVSL